MSESVLLVLVVAAALVSVAALVLALVALAAGRGRRRGAPPGELPSDVEGLRAEVARLQRQAEHAVSHLGVVRYDAFADMGGRLSWSVALLDDSGSGVVLTSIHGRSEARAYAKNVTGWTSDQALSPEEERAIKEARGA